MKKLNKDYITRDTIIFGGYHPESYLGGVRRFECSRAILKRLVNMKFADPSECQNDSPSIRDFLAMTENTKSDIEFLCYAVSPERVDYRITVEGINIVIPDTEHEMISDCIESFRDADEFSFNHMFNGYHLHAWWD